MARLARALAVITVMVVLVHSCTALGLSWPFGHSVSTSGKVRSPATQLEIRDRAIDVSEIPSIPLFRGTTATEFCRLDASSTIVDTITHINAYRTNIGKLIIPHGEIVQNGERCGGDGTGITQLFVNRDFSSAEAANSTGVLSIYNEFIKQRTASIVFTAISEAERESAGFYIGYDSEARICGGKAAWPAKTFYLFINTYLRFTDATLGSIERNDGTTETGMAVFKPSGGVCVYKNVVTELPGLPSPTPAPLSALSVADEQQIAGIIDAGAVTIPIPTTTDTIPGTTPIPVEQSILDEPVATTTTATSKPTLGSNTTVTSVTTSAITSTLITTAFNTTSLISIDSATLPIDVPVDESIAPATTVPDEIADLPTESTVAPPVMSSTIASGVTTLVPNESASMPLLESSTIVPGATITNPVDASAVSVTAGIIDPTGHSTSVLIVTTIRPVESTTTTPNVTINAQSTTVTSMETSDGILASTTITPSESTTIDAPIISSIATTMVSTGSTSITLVNGTVLDRDPPTVPPPVQGVTVITVSSASPTEIQSNATLVTLIDSSTGNGPPNGIDSMAIPSSMPSTFNDTEVVEITLTGNGSDPAVVVNSNTTPEGAPINATINDVVNIIIPLEGGGNASLAFNFFNLVSGSEGISLSSTEIENVIEATLGDVLHITVPTMGGLTSTVIELHTSAFLSPLMPVAPTDARREIVDVAQVTQENGGIGERVQ
jgi:hypothetical protein